MSVRLLTWAERPDLAERGPASEAVWPEYNRHGDVFDEWWTPLLEELPEFQFALYDEHADVVLAESHTGPLSWSGDDRELPAGIDDALQRIVAERRASAPVDALCALAAEVAPDARQRGLAVELLGGMRELAGRQQLRRLIAPVRPSWKECYPLAPIERYVSWRREDGRLLDPWMRLHEQAGSTRRHRVTALDAHHGYRRRVGGLDRPPASRIRRLRIPPWPGAAHGRPRSR